MPEIRATCPACQVRMKTANMALAGKKIKCPKCGATCPLGMPGSVPGLKDGVARGEDKELPAPAREALDRRGKPEKRKARPEEDEGRPRKRKGESAPKKRSLLPLFLFGGLGLVVLGGLGALGAWALGLFGGNDVPPRRTPPPVMSTGGAEKVSPFAVRLSGKNHIRLANTKDLLDLNKPFTIEMWVRWRGTPKGEISLAGDDVAPGVVPGAVRLGGWVLRASAPTSGQRAVEFAVADPNPVPRGDWFLLRGDLKPESDAWQHIAVSRMPTPAPESIRIYRNGEINCIRPCPRKSFVPSHTDLFLGVRQPAPEDRTVEADIRAFRISSGVRYPRPFTPPAGFGPDRDDLLLLDFSTGKGISLTDRSGKGHNGTIVGGTWVPVDVGKP
jgi:hypothetical protein